MRVRGSRKRKGDSVERVEGDEKMEGGVDDGVGSAGG